MGDFIESTVWLREVAEVLTVVISFLGAFIAVKHAAFYNHSESELSKKMRSVFATDALIYIVTLIMGLGLFFNWHAVIHFDVIVRPLALLLNVWASIRLYRHYNGVK